MYGRTDVHHNGPLAEGVELAVQVECAGLLKHDGPAPRTRRHRAQQLRWDAQRLVVESDVVLHACATNRINIRTRRLVVPGSSPH